MPPPAGQSTLPRRAHVTDRVLSLRPRDLGPGGQARRDLEPVVPVPRGLGAAVQVLQLADGDVLELGRPERGLRTCLAVRGGLAVEPVLGSRATDRLGGIGPAPLVVGDVLPVAALPSSGAPHLESTRSRRVHGDDPVLSVTAHDVGARATGEPESEGGEEHVVLRVEPGPHAHWFDDRWPSVLCSPEGFTVLPASDRVAVRLDGPPLTRSRGFVGRELAPVGLVPGAVQVPPDGSPVVFGVDHPVTGGYPVVAVLRLTDVDRLAQLRPGDRVQMALTLAQ
ncbi:allophanate hydrolase subunit 2 family protein [Cellulomonas sp. DKR-3]|uniref:Allophanate hydrolase subunit 2 family protein n=2 Tax=Cellulomonas fulva TaxID=2835530 RepID=A0ABS5TYD8_9CELL|nr:allophanate hydrolase subunit 2 family protein [Cellulomonas fulva]